MEIRRTIPEPQSMPASWGEGKGGRAKEWDEGGLKGWGNQGSKQKKIWEGSSGEPAVDRAKMRLGNILYICQHLSHWWLRAVLVSAENESLTKRDKLDIVWDTYIHNKRIKVANPGMINTKVQESSCLWKRVNDWTGVLQQINFVFYVSHEYTWYSWCCFLCLLN